MTTCFSDLSSLQLIPPTNTIQPTRTRNLKLNQELSNSAHLLAGRNACYVRYLISLRQRCPHCFSHIFHVVIPSSLKKRTVVWWSPVKCYWDPVEGGGVLPFCTDMWHENTVLEGLRYWCEFACQRGGSYEVSFVSHYLTWYTAPSKWLLMIITNMFSFSVNHIPQHISFPMLPQTAQKHAPTQGSAEPDSKVCTFQFLLICRIINCGNHHAF